MSIAATTTRAHAHAQVGTEVWSLALRRSFSCAGRTVWVLLDALRSEDGSPRFSVKWQPDRPSRLTSTDMAHFDRSKSLAVAELLAELSAWQMPRG